MVSDFAVLTLTSSSASACAFAPVPGHQRGALLQKTGVQHVTRSVRPRLSLNVLCPSRVG